MRSWEARHRDRLTEAEVESTQFFGFAGQGVLGKLIDFVFISADLRAYEETDDNKASVVGRILEHAVDRSEAEAQFTAIDEDARAAREKVHEEIYAPVLTHLSGALSQEVARFTTGRHVVVTPTAQVPKRTRTAFAVNIRDGAALTPVRRQGHGFQRALIIAALRVPLGMPPSRKRHAFPVPGDRGARAVQHPAQTRVFAQVLRSLVESAEDQTQVMYATHSPVFINPSDYRQVRRLYRVPGGDHPEVHLWELTEAQLRQSLDGYVEEKSIARRGATRYVKDLAEALFANVTVVVEGVTDEGILLAFAERQGLNLGAEGICVLNAEGKDNMLLCHAILTGFGVHCYLVFDADTGPKNQAGPANESQEKREKRDTRLRESSGKNKKIFDYLRVLTAASPSTVSEASYTVFEDDLETYLKDDWPAWTARCQELIKQGAGYVQGKHVPTYAEAARTANGEPKVLHSLLENAMDLIRQPMPRP
ncbi:AAA family ATPase [Streptomyces hirsutus]